MALKHNITNSNMPPEALGLSEFSFFDHLDLNKIQKR